MPESPFTRPPALFAPSAGKGSPYPANLRDKAEVAASVALAILEAIRLQDAPAETLDEEDPAKTLPRRLGLSDVVEAQIRRYREQARRRKRITDAQILDLVRLVIRRPDAEEVFFRAGQTLASEARGGRWLVRILPLRVRLALARRKTHRLFWTLFRRRLGGFGRGPFRLEARGHFLLELDPGGEACHLVSGLAQACLKTFVGEWAELRHSPCQALGGEQCTWFVDSPAAPTVARGAPKPVGRLFGL